MVWVPVLEGDLPERALEASRLLADPRARHFWDRDAGLARWFWSRGISHWPALEDRSPFRWELAWDVFLLYGPEARWDDGPTPPPVAGATVMRDREVLRQAVARRVPGGGSADE